MTKREYINIFNTASNFNVFKVRMRKYKLKLKTVRRIYNKCKREPNNGINYNKLIINEVVEDNYQHLDNLLGIVNYTQLIKIKDMFRLKQKITEKLLKKEGFSYAIIKKLKEKIEVK